MGFTTMKNHSMTVNICLLIIFSYIEFFNIYGLTEMSSDHWENFQQYAPMMSLMQPTCISLILIHTYVQFCLGLRDNMFALFCSLDKADSLFQQKLSNDIKLAKFVCFSYFIVIQLIYFSMFPYVGDENRFIYFLKVISEVGQYGVIFYISTAASFIISSFATAYPPIVAIYFVLHIKFQTDLLNHYVEEHIKNLVPDRSDWMTDTSYQNMIHHRLGACVKHHHGILKSFQKIASGPSKSTILLLYLGACFMLMGGLYFLIAEISPASNFRIYLTFIGGIAEALLFISGGQILVDVSNRYYDILCECPWYNWDTRNRKLFLNMLVGARRPFTISCFGVADLDFVFILKLTKTSYSVLAIAKNLK